MKKIISCLLILTLTAGIITYTASADNRMPFTDVKETNWFYEAVAEVNERGIMTGVSDTLFAPNGSLSRAMYVTMLGRLAGAPSTGYKKDSFPDTKKDTWYSPYVGWAVENGVVSGFEDGTFRPDENLTREQMAKAMSEYIRVSGVRMPRETTAPSVFADDEKTAKWAREYVEQLRRAGILNGDSKGRFNPKNSITRAEAATVIINLIRAVGKAWQGYEPDAETDGYAVYGARYIYDNAALSAGAFDVSLVTDGFEYPALSAFADENTRRCANTEDNGTTGMSLTAANLFAGDFPYVRVCYRYGNGNERTPGAIAAFVNARVNTVPLTVKDGGSEDGWRVAYIDFGELDGAERLMTDIVQLQLTPFADGEEEDEFYIRYFAFFADETERNGFTSEKLSDYLKNYRLYSNIDLSEMTDEVEDGVRTLISERIKEIRNTESEITPEMIESRGGTCYYISSEHGDDSNDGKSPETPWKTTKRLQRKIGDDVYIGYTTKRGDGVFFERGNTFYATIYTPGTKVVLLANPGVYYGAYGEGDKPVLTCALDFGGTNGRWLQTEWENVWELDPEQIDKEALFRTQLCDIGNIIFNGGQYIGVKITPSEDYRTGKDVSSDEYMPFGEGKTSLDVGIISNGVDWFEVRERDLTNPGTALRNNLEFIQNRKEGRLFLYWDGGDKGIENPADAFDDIKVSRNSTAIISSTEDRPVYDFSSVWFDNLSLKYATDYLARLEGKDITFTNCEIGFSNKSIGCVASGIEIYGDVDGWDIRNCYFHEIGDGPMSSQGGDGYHSENIHWEHNVVVCCGCGAEIWQCGTENGAYLKNIRVNDNIFAYIGAGLIQSGNYGALVGGSVLNGYIYGTNNTADCVYENNLIFEPIGEIFPTYIALDGQPSGWIVRDNTYIANKNYVCMYKGFDSFAYKKGGYSANGCAGYPFNERYLGYLASCGMDPTGKYIWYDKDDSAKAGYNWFRFRFITGWYVERPDTETVMFPENMK